MHKGVRYKIIAHFQPELVGASCVVAMRTKHGFHAAPCDDAGKVIKERERETITIWWWWSENWVFEGNLCTVYNDPKKHTKENLILSIRILD